MSEGAAPPLMDAEARKLQVGGNHYASKPIQPWDVILVYGLDFWEGNALKYLLRDKVNRLEDLRKARHYLDECIRQLEAQQPADAGAVAVPVPVLSSGSASDLVPHPLYPLGLPPVSRAEAFRIAEEFKRTAPSFRVPS